MFRPWGFRFLATDHNTFNASSSSAAPLIRSSAPVLSSLDAASLLESNVDSGKGFGNQTHGHPFTAQGRQRLHITYLRKE
jgi:hypothetical protein